MALLTPIGPIHGVSSVASGFESGTLRPQSRDLTTRPPRPHGGIGFRVCSPPAPKPLPYELATTPPCKRNFHGIRRLLS
ncbi:hypothetical protein AVEN_29287-1 [Araneus ventricosus]|uniref:Uncharacterized protein n=1 Tax=Araneus ventricosus TaxID=182803 RepID=A0A4Y2SY77_ARAVE|nr:hypothetical protein AVEN_29287-1 [Araneus ventricosus]